MRVLGNMITRKLNRAAAQKLYLMTGFIKTTDHRPPTNRPTDHLPLTHRPTDHLPTDPPTGLSSIYIKIETRF